jgi:hypothetical protein
MYMFVQAMGEQAQVSYFLFKLMIAIRQGLQRESIIITESISRSYYILQRTQCNIMILI